jgi:hypothetical protein
MNQDQLVAVPHDNNEHPHVVHQLLVHHQDHRQNELYIRNTFFLYLSIDYNIFE